MDVEHIEIREHLRRHPPFAHLPIERLNTIATAVEIAYFRAGSDILVSNADIHDLHYIRSGTVDIYRRNGALYNRLGEGEIFGQLSLMTGKKVRFPARAVEDSLLYFIPETLFHELFAEDEHFADFVELEDRIRLRKAGVLQSSNNDLKTTRVGKLIKRVPSTVAETDSVQTAAVIMLEKGVGAILVTVNGQADGIHPPIEHHDILGVVTETDLCQKVIAQRLDLHTPVQAVMSDQVVTIDEDQYLFEALLLMLKHHISYLPALRRLRLIGVIDMADIISYESQSSLFVVRNILTQEHLEGLRQLSPDVRASFCRMVNEDANARMVGSAVAMIGRTFKQRLLELGEQRLGAPPVPYCFLALGSMARDEQLMLTDQDNALVLSDDFDPQQHDEYFQALATFVCDGLAELGYSYCKGGVMATNAPWRQPLAVWKQYFTRWINQPKPEALLNSSIFFDLDGVYGDTAMAVELQQLIAQQASQAPHFLGCLAFNAQSRTPPLGFFNQFVVETSGSQRDSLNIKRRGSAPMVDVIRVHALASASLAQNSFLRLDDISAAGFLTAGMTADLRDALEFITMAHIRHQAARLESGQEADNYINPEMLTRFDRRNLKAAFQVLANAQKFLKYRYRPQ